MGVVRGKHSSKSMTMQGHKHKNRGEMWKICKAIQHFTHWNAKWGKFKQDITKMLVTLQKLKTLNILILYDEILQPLVMTD